MLSDPAQAACKKVVTELREEYDLKEKNLRKEFELKEQKVSLALGATRYQARACTRTHASTSKLSLLCRSPPLATC